MIFGKKERILYGNRFNGTKGNGYQPIKKVMTNEEWIKQCNTEQLADKLTDFSFWLVPTIPTEDKREQIRKKIELWLKEKHNGV